MSEQALPFAFFEGKIVPIADARVNIQTNALQYGTGVFAGIRGYYNNSARQNFLAIFRLDDHLKRFLNALKILGVGLDYSQDQLRKIVLDLVEKNQPRTDVYFRPFAYAGDLRLSPNLVGLEKFALYMLPLGDYLPTHKGLKVAVSSWWRNSDNVIPSRGKFSGAYINSALAKSEAVRNGYDEAIMLTQSGHVAEGSAMNLFMVRDGVLITSPVSDDILEGITRRTILQLAEDLHIPYEVRSVDRTELYVCDELFFAGTGVQVAWIAAVDQRQIGDGKRGPITAQLQDLYFRTVRGEEKKYEQWCTKVSL